MALRDILIEHKKEYNKKAIDELFEALSKDSSTRMRSVDEAKSIFGFVRFYFGYYVIFVTEYSKLGKIGEHVINRVEKTKILPLFVVNQQNEFLDLENK